MRGTYAKSSWSSGRREADRERQGHCRERRCQAPLPLDDGHGLGRPDLGETPKCTRGLPCLRGVERLAARDLSQPLDERSRGGVRSVGGLRPSIDTVDAFAGRPDLDHQQ